MLAKLAESLPDDGAFLFEPKWDGFRAIVFRGAADVYIQSRDLKPLDRYFPELHDVLLTQLPKGSVIDGEIVIATARGLDFDALQMRLHPAASRVAKLANQTPASFVAFDLLASGGRDRRAAPQRERRALLEKLFAKMAAPLHLTPMTEDRGLAEQWLEQFEGAGLDGVVAKAATLTYQPGKRAMIKVKHARTADCVVAGFRWYKRGPVVGSLLLGLHDERGELQHVGVTSSFSLARRQELLDEIAPYRLHEGDHHPWMGSVSAERIPGGLSRWSGGKDLSWEPLRPGLVCEVTYDHMEGRRFRHTAQFKRWRPDRDPASCNYEQIERPVAFDLDEILASRAT